MKRIIILLILVAGLVTAGLTACNPADNTITIASKPVTEQYIIVEMLTYLIEENTSLNVVQNLGVQGGTGNIHPAMLDGTIDLYPEYTGTGWLYVLKEESINDATEQYNEVKEAYEEEFGITWMGRYGFNNTYGLAIKEELAESLNINTYSDLAAYSSELSFGAEEDFFDREDGYEGLQETYGMDFRYTSDIDIGQKYDAVNNGDVDVIDVFSTDGRLNEYNLRLLEDDLNYFKTYEAATIIRTEVLEAHPELNDVLAMLDGQISNEEMISMNYQVDVEDKDPQDVALAFLEEKGLK
jgi:glycine betaine/choline ABC-type transport system substrate-binding protein